MSGVGYYPADSGPGAPGVTETGAGGDQDAFFNSTHRREMYTFSRGKTTWFLLLYCREI